MPDDLFGIALLIMTASFPSSPAQRHIFVLVVGVVPPSRHNLVCRRRPAATEFQGAAVATVTGMLVLHCRRG